MPVDHFDGAKEWVCLLAVACLAVPGLDLARL